MHTNTLLKGLFSQTMSHQTEIEKRKYRNWVRGGLAYKYLKQGLEGFADDVVKQDHKRILSAIKCFINAPGYSDKTKAADIDISGLLLVFINNTDLHSHLACSMAGKNVFVKVRERRNKLFHSATMEVEEWEMFECIDDIVEILEDPKQLKGRPEVQQAVNKLKQLKNSDFLITTHNEVEVCREALASVNLKSKEIEQAIQDAKNVISDEKKDIVEGLQQVADKHKEDVKDVSDQVTGTANETIRKSLHGAVKEFDKHSEILYERIKKLETGVSERLGKLETDFSSVEKIVKILERNKGELECKRQKLMSHLDHVKGKQDATKNQAQDEHILETPKSPISPRSEIVHPEWSRNKGGKGSFMKNKGGYSMSGMSEEVHDNVQQGVEILSLQQKGTVQKRWSQLSPISDTDITFDFKLEENGGDLSPHGNNTVISQVNAFDLPKSTSSVPLSKDSKLALSSTDEEIRSKDSQEDEILNDSELTKLLLREGRMSQKVFKECKRICKLIKNKCKDIVHVEAAYEFEDDKHVIFLVFAEKNIEIHSIWKTEIRIINSYSNESHVVLYNEENSPLKEKESQQIAEIIDRHSKKLMRDHKFLSAISASSVLSKRFKYDEHKVEKRPCIVLNVLVKGIIPLNEEYFPTELDGIPVDVREGGVRLCVNVAKRFQKSATIGCKITSSKFPEKYGTLGGFIEHPEYGLCGITCAHVFLTALEKFTIKGISTKNVVNENVTIHQPDVSEFQNKLGQLIQITYKEGENDKPGVDLALFKIEKRAPKKGQFPDEQFPEFNDGLVWGKTGIPNGLREVRKFGCVSLETRGVMQCDDSVIRECPFTSYLDMGEELRFTTTLYKQYHIKSFDKDIPFCKQGDSGALVFMEDNTGEETTLRCIGMVVAVSEDNTGYVTPITAILDELKVKQFKPFTTHSTISTLLEQMRGMFETHSDRFDERFRQLEERISGIETAMNTNN